jgi:hypothetical protein
MAEESSVPIGGVKRISSKSKNSYQPKSQMI